MIIIVLHARNIININSRQLLKKKKIKIRKNYKKKNHNTKSTRVLFVSRIRTMRIIRILNLYIILTEINLIFIYRRSL